LSKKVKKEAKKLRKRKGENIEGKYKERRNGDKIYRSGTRVHPQRL